MAIYLIRSGLGGDVKIGTARDPLKRLKSLQTSHPHKLRLIRVLEGDRDVERLLHQKFSALRKSGEWFRFSDAMMVKDIGYADLPIPMGKRDHADDTPARRRVALHQDIIECLGGVDAIARRLGVAPWEAVEYSSEILPKYFSAVALLMRDAGYQHVTVDLLLSVQRAEHEAHTKSAQASSENGRKERAERFMALWLKKHGTDGIWWETQPGPAKQEAAA